MWKATSHMVQHNYLHVEIEMDNLHVSETRGGARIQDLEGPN